MSSFHLGFYNTSGTRTLVSLLYSTHAAAGGNVAPSTAIDAADIRIYRAAHSIAVSATERSSSSGITSTSPFDSLTGFHAVDIDLTDNTDAGFYAAGYRYYIVFAPNDETIDSQTITGVLLGFFEIGAQPSNVTQFGGTAGTFSSGRPEVNTTHVAGTSQTAGDLAAMITAVEDYVDTEVAAIKAKTDNLPSDPADASDIAASFSSIASTLATIASYIDMEVAAIKAKTDNLPASPAATGDAMTLTSAYDFAKGTVAPTESYRSTNAVPTPIQALLELIAHMGESSISSTTKTLKKVDGSTTAKTFTLNDATTPTSITEAT